AGMSPGSRGVLERTAASDLWRHTLSQITSIFGRLVYLSSLRSVHTGQYEHHGLSLLFGEEEADRALVRSHEESLLGWLEMRLEDQKADVDHYLDNLPGNRREVIENWLRLSPYRNLVPAGSAPMQREHFAANFEALLVLLKNEYGVSDPNQDA
ncbi:MAG: hypothetical protein WKF37_13375, partial [Bryobacteraceae bacterium]